MLNVDSRVQLEHFRDYLHLLARMHIDPRLRKDCDPSDIVQTVLLRAHQGQEGFRGTTQEELGAGCDRSWPTRSLTPCGIVCAASATFAVRSTWNSR